jgi:hypothetical protein
MNGIGHNSFFARILNWTGIDAKTTGVSMYDVWLHAKTATGCLESLSAPRIVRELPVIHNDTLAHTRAISCCTRPRLSTIETTSESDPKKIVATANAGD